MGTRGCDSLTTRVSEWSNFDGFGGRGATSLGFRNGQRIMNSLSLPSIPVESLFVKESAFGSSRSDTENSSTHSPTSIAARESNFGDVDNSFGNLSLSFKSERPRFRCSARRRIFC